VVEWGLRGRDLMGKGKLVKMINGWVAAIKRKRRKRLSSPVLFDKIEPKDRTNHNETCHAILHAAQPLTNKFADDAEEENHDDSQICDL